VTRSVNPGPDFFSGSATHRRFEGYMLRIEDGKTAKAVLIMVGAYMSLDLMQVVGSTVVGAAPLAIGRQIAASA
jgi:hypothetical protein